jgi:hypothetical protein
MRRRLRRNVPTSTTTFTLTPLNRAVIAGGLEDMRLSVSAAERRTLARTRHRTPRWLRRYATRSSLVTLSRRMLQTLRSVRPGSDPFLRTPFERTMYEGSPRGVGGQSVTTVLVVTADNIPSADDQFLPGHLSDQSE